MKILLWSELFWPYLGGAELFAVNLLPALTRTGHQFMVLTSHDHIELPDCERLNGIPIRRFPIRTAIKQGDLAALTTIRKDIQKIEKEFQPEIIHWFTAGSMYLLMARPPVEGNPKTLVRLNNVLPVTDHSPEDSLLSKVLTRANWVTANSEVVLGQARGTFPQISGRSSVIYNGMPASKTTHAMLPFCPAVVMTIGRLVPAKGLSVALEAYARVVKRFTAVQLMIVGDGPERRNLETLARKLGIRHKVKFTGWVAPDKISELLNSATLVLQPSEKEGVPNSVIAAAYQGRPAVATDVGGNREVVLHRKTGIIVPHGDTEALIEAIIELLENPKMATEMGHHAQQHAAHRFDWDHCVREYDRLYHQLHRSTIDTAE